MDAHDAVVAAIDAFDGALRARDLGAAERVWALDRDDVAIVGSAAAEWFVGPIAVRACLAGIMSRGTTHGWRWIDRRVTVHGDVAWVTAEAAFQTIHSEGAIEERPYRVTAVLIRDDPSVWRWYQYHGSEPLGSIG